MSLEIRQVEPSEAEAFSSATSFGFGNQPTADGIEWWRDRIGDYEPLAAFEDGAIVGTAAIQRLPMVLEGGAQAETAAVTMVAVRPTHRRRGVLTALMRRQLDDVHASGRAFAALWASESLIYGRFGYGAAVPLEWWRIDRTRTGMVEARDVGGRARILASGEAREVLPALFEAAGAGRPAWMPRRELEWDRLFHEAEREKAKAPFHVAYEVNGVPRGYATYRVKPRWTDMIAESTLAVEDLVALDPEAEAALWAYIFGVDLVQEIRVENRPSDDPLPWRLRDPRRLQRRTRDGIWLRLVDVEAALPQRSYGVAGTLGIEVDDPFCPWNEGRYRLDAGEAGASCRRDGASPDLVMAVDALAAVFHGGVRPSTLAAAGRIEERSAGALRRADAMFATARAPWCRTFF